MLKNFTNDGTHRVNKEGLSKTIKYAREQAILKTLENRKNKEEVKAKWNTYTIAKKMVVIDNLEQGGHFERVI